MENKFDSSEMERELFKKLENAGLTDQLLKKVISSVDNKLAKKIVRMIKQNGDFEPTTSQNTAREIMGTNYFNIEHASSHLGVNPTRQQIAALAEVPFSEKELCKCSNSHILVAVFPMSIIEIRKNVKPDLFYSHENSWYISQAFAKDRGEGVAWCLIYKTPIPGSLGESWEKQQTLIAKNEEIPTARVLVYTIIGHYLVTGEKLFKNVCVRSSNLDSYDSRVSIGSFDANGLHISTSEDDVCIPNTGAVSQRLIFN